MIMIRKESQAWAAVIHLNLVISVNSILDRIPAQSNSRSASPVPDQYIIEPDNELRRIKMRLRPLREVEDIMSRQMSADNTPILRLHSGVPWSNDRVFVRSGSGWKTSLGLRARQAPGPDHLNDARQIIDACKEDIAALWNHPAVQAVKQDQVMSLQEQANLFVLSNNVRE
jgi:guanine nucleotide-binding protein G(i) subunit alpha